jgi:membrane protease YdiL (CAAX protease family)
MEGTRVRRKRRPSPPASGWTIGYATGALVVSVGMAILLVLLLSRQQLRLGIGVLAFDAVLLAALVPLRRRRRFTARALGLTPAPPARSVGLVVLAAIALAVVNVFWLQGVLGLKQAASQGITLHESTAAAILTGLALAVCAPVSEEIFFRGFLYRACRNRMAVAPAALLNGLIFAAVHGLTYPLDTLPPRIAFGVIACLLYEYTGSLYPGIALHCLIDAAGFEAATTGHNGVALLVFAALGAVVLLYAALRPRAGRRADGRRRLAVTTERAG